MAHREPPSTPIALAWIGGAFVALVLVNLGFLGLNVVITAMANAPAAMPVAVAQPRMSDPAPLYTPPVQNHPPVYTPPPTPVYTPSTPAAPPPQLHLSFTDIDDALKYVQNGQSVERRAAATYLESAKPDAASHDKVLAAARVLVADEAYRASAVAMIKTWAGKNDLPVLQEILTSMLQTGAANSPTGAAHVRTMIELLSGFGDKDAVTLYAQGLQTPAIRPTAAAALLAMGSDCETAVQPLALSDDRDVAAQALKILAQVGTEKSTMTFHRAIYFKTPEISAAAEAALKDFATRLNLKPEQGLDAVFGHYAFDAPASFLPDTAYTKANSRQWTRTAPNRSVKSVFTITVKLVPQGYTLSTVPGPETVVGTLKFQAVEATQSTNVTTTVHFAAVEGEFLVDVRMVLDTRDPIAETSMTKALMSIHAK